MSPRASKRLDDVPTPPGISPAGRYRSLADFASLSHFIQKVREGIYITTPDGEILDANPAFLEIFGVPTVEELRQLRVTDLMADPAQRAEELDRIEREGAVREFELVLRRPDGQLRTVIDTSYAVTDPETGERLYHGILVDITARKALEEQLIQMSLHDPLTGCLNRRILTEVDDAFAADPDQPWGAIFVDIDRFKRYNDEFGHASGDDVLVRMGRFLARYVRAEEAVVRFGGDEFLVLLRGADADRTAAVAERLREAALTAAPVPFSLGWAARQVAEPLARLIDRADRGMLAVRVSDRGRATRRESDR